MRKTLQQLPSKFPANSQQFSRNFPLFPQGIQYSSRRRTRKQNFRRGSACACSIMKLVLSAAALLSTVGIASAQTVHPCVGDAIKRATSSLAVVFANATLFHVPSQELPRVLGASAFSAKDYLSDFPPWSNPENRLVTVLFCCNPLRLVWKTDLATNWQFKIQNARAILRSSREIVQ
jgi:hypothetical protein